MNIYKYAQSMRRMATIAVIATIAVPASYAAEPQLLVEMPVPPSEIVRMDQRANYILDNFWKNCNFKSIFSSKERLDYTMGQFFALTPLATADTVHIAINRLLTGVEKSAPKQLPELARIAERWTYADSAEYQSDELYLPFVKAVVDCKKVKGAERARFEAQYTTLTSSSVGCTVPDFEFVRPDGSIGHFGEVDAPHILLMFFDPDCADCRLAKARFSADYAINWLCEKGILKIVAIYPGEDSDQWRAEALDMPDTWVKGSYADADTYFAMPTMPMLYYIDKQHVVQAKDVKPDNVLKTFQALVRSIVNSAQAADSDKPAGNTDEEQNKSE